MTSLDSLSKEIENTIASVNRTMNSNKEKLMMRISQTSELIENISIKIGNKQEIIESLKKQLLDKTLESRANKEAELEKKKLQSELTKSKQELSQFMEQNGMLQLELARMQESYNTMMSQTAQQMMNINKLMLDIEKNINLNGQNLDIFLQKTNEDLDIILNDGVIDVEEIVIPLNPSLETVEEEPIIEGEEVVIEGEEPIIEEEEPIIEESILSSFGIDDSESESGYESEYDY